jgi:hypothetical protein
MWNKSSQHLVVPQEVLNMESQQHNCAIHITRKKWVGRSTSFERNGHHPGESIKPIEHMQHLKDASLW